MILFSLLITTVHFFFDAKKYGLYDQNPSPPLEYAIGLISG